MAEKDKFWNVHITEHGRDAVFNLTGLERSFRYESGDLDLLDDDLVPALQMERLQALALDHLGGLPGEHDILAHLIEDADRLRQLIFGAHHQ